MIQIQVGLGTIKRGGRINIARITGAFTSVPIPSLTISCWFTMLVVFSILGTWNFFFENSLI